MRKKSGPRLIKNKKEAKLATSCIIFVHSISLGLLKIVVLRKMDMKMEDFNAPHSMGTTIIGVTYNGGVVLGADSRTSTGIF